MLRVIAVDLFSVQALAEVLPFDLLRWFVEAGVRAGPNVSCLLVAVFIAAAEGIACSVSTVARADLEGRVGNIVYRLNSI